MSRLVLQVVAGLASVVLSSLAQGPAVAAGRGARNNGPGAVPVRQWDRNDDLIIDDAELAAGLAELKARLRAKPLADAVRSRRLLTAMDANGDGQLSDEEVTAATARIVEQVKTRNRMMLMHADADRDGIVSEAEREAIRRRAAEGVHRVGRGGGAARREEPEPQAPPYMQ
jgi:Ca2+-binding EF-hand superfamily protein